MATWYLSKCCYRGPALASGQQWELDMLCTHKNKEAVNQHEDSFYFFTLETFHSFIFTTCSISLSGLLRERSKLHVFFHPLLILLWSSGSYDTSFPCCSL